MRAAYVMQKNRLTQVQSHLVSLKETISEKKIALYSLLNGHADIQVIAHYGYYHASIPLIFLQCNALAR